MIESTPRDADVQPPMRIDGTRANWLFWIAASLLLILQVVLPGDAPWINDEPRFVEKAIEANASGVLESEGLVGHLSVPYGSLPTRVYQVALLVTSDLVWIIAVKALLSSVVVLLSLLWMSRIVGLPRPPVLLALASPYLFFYGRLLWDNCFLIPLSVACIAVFASFVSRPRISSLAGILLLGVAMIETHLMCVYLVVPLGLCMLAMQWRWFMTRWWQVLLVSVGTLALAWPYLSKIVHGSMTIPTQATPPWTRVMSALWSARYLTFDGFARDFIPEFASANPWASPAVVRALVIATLVVWIPAAAGAIDLLCRASLRAVQGKALDTGLRLGVLSWAILLSTIAFYWHFELGALYRRPHYVNAVWFPALYFCWWFLARHWARRRVRALYWGHLGLMAGLLVMLVAFVHVNGGNRGIHYGSTIRNQIAVAREISCYGLGTPISPRSRNESRFPHALRVLQEIQGFPEEGVPAYAPGLVIDYADGAEATTGFIAVWPRE